MRCHYAVLNVSQDASDSDLKKAYRDQCLKWHPDKNPDNLEEAKREFILVQQAFNVLSDPFERTNYDAHREELLRGDTDLWSRFINENVPASSYFKESCYQGFGDDVKGFYSVYSRCFRALGDEEFRFLGEDDGELPEFGDSSSSYEIVDIFYGHWLSFSTKNPFSELKPVGEYYSHRRSQRDADKNFKKLQRSG